MDTTKYQKIFSALELPMKPDESLDYDALSQLIEYELSIGVNGSRLWSTSYPPSAAGYR